VMPVYKARRELLLSMYYEIFVVVHDLLLGKARTITKATATPKPTATARSFAQRRGSG
jgi:hypothetical protein